MRMLTRVQHSQVVLRIFSSSSNFLTISRNPLPLQWMKATKLPHSAEQRTSSVSEAGDADSSTPRQATTCKLTFSISPLIMSVNTLASACSDCWKVFSMTSYSTERRTAYAPPGLRATGSGAVSPRVP